MLSCIATKYAWYFYQAYTRWRTYNHMENSLSCLSPIPRERSTSGSPTSLVGEWGCPYACSRSSDLLLVCLAFPACQLIVDKWQLASDLDTKQTILQITAAGLCRTLTYFPWLNAGAKVVLFSLFSKFIAMFLDYIFISSQVPCKLGDHYRRSLGLLWAFCGFSVSNICASIIMLQKSSARKGFCAEDL